MTPVVIRSLQRDLLVSKLLCIHPGVLSLGLHTFVSLTIVLFLLSSVIFVWTTEVNQFNYKFLKQGYDNKAFYFSLWVSTTTIICFGMYSVIDVLAIYGTTKQLIKTKKIRKTLHDLANHILFSLVFPLSLVVSILFWGFYFWNRELIYPKILDEILPTFFNHIIHTFPVPISILYMFTDVKTEPPKSKTLISLSVFMIIYSLVFFEVHNRTGLWIYPVLEALTLSQIKWVLTSTVIGSFIFYLLGYYLYGKVKVLQLYLKTESRRLKIHHS